MIKYQGRRVKNLSDIENDNISSMGESQYIDLARLAETDIGWDGQRNQMSRPT